MELKTPKAKKKTSETKLKMWKILRTQIFILFLIGTTSCENDYFGDPETSLAETIDDIEPRHRHHRLENTSDSSLSESDSSLSESDRSVLEDIRYLRRHLNREIVNFVMRDTLVDGEVENRLHYNGVTAKETYAGSQGSGLRLRQLTDGRHLVQVIYAANNEMQDCEIITQGKMVRTFLKEVRKELKQALTEENLKIMNAYNSSEDKFVRHFANVTFKILKRDDRLPSDVAVWMNYDKLKLQCLHRHEELKYMMENKNKITEESLSRSRRSVRENFILPGTKWCGAGQLAERYDELGTEITEDKCCRAHDNCRVNIGAFKRRFGYHNMSPVTVSHCRCDRRSKRDAMEILRVPGTKWCGKGFSATKYSQLGGYTRTDRCCRVHDLRCPFWIGGMEKKYGLYNWRVNTLMHCRCDERFRACLKLADTSVSNMVGKLFFNVVQTKCFVLKPIKICVQRSWWGKCLQKGYKKQAYLRSNLRY